MIKSKCMFGDEFWGDDVIEHWENDCIGNPEAKNHKTKQGKCT